MGNLLSDNIAYVVYDPTMLEPERILITRNTTTFYGGGLVTHSIGTMDSDMLHRDGFIRVMCYNSRGIVPYAIELFEDGSARLAVRVNGFKNKYVTAGRDRDSSNKLYWKKFRIVKNLPRDSIYTPSYGMYTKNNTLSVVNHPHIIRIPIRTLDGYDEKILNLSKSEVMYLIDLDSYDLITSDNKVHNDSYINRYEKIKNA